MTGRWSYSGTTGPAHWGDLDPTYATCKLGTMQSPVDITETTPNASLGPLATQYEKSPLAIINNGHTIQVNYESGSTLSLDGRTFELLQFHFHAPSEHLVGGVAFDMEVHLVHRDADGNYAVIGVLMTEGAEHPLVAQCWRRLPEAHKAAHPAVRIDAQDLFPLDGHFYAYEGSLTTPPCSEGVRWIVMKKPVEVSREQIDRFRQAIGPNARPVMPLNDRIIEAF